MSEQAVLELFRGYRKEKQVPIRLAFELKVHHKTELINSEFEQMLADLTDPTFARIFCDPGSKIRVRDSGILLDRIEKSKTEGWGDLMKTVSLIETHLKDQFLISGLYIIDRVTFSRLKLELKGADVTVILEDLKWLKIEDPNNLLTKDIMATSHKAGGVEPLPSPGLGLPEYFR